MMVDAHNHLHDERLTAFQNDFIPKLRRDGVTQWMVNGTCEEDWEAVAEFAKKYPSEVVPNFGLHPWFIKTRTADWDSRLNDMLDRFPNAGVGEVGIDKWIRDHEIEVQEPIFEKQIQVAATRQIPLSIHCLKAFGRLADILKRNPLPKSGFLLHSYSGPAELVEEFIDLGAYFSIAGYFMHERKASAREIFREIPIERLLIETDAPDMALPDSKNPNPLPDSLNSPVNLPVVYKFAAELREMDLGSFKDQIAANFNRFRGLA